jgi:drug/metabolite transporter (DMT)-like permease
MSWFLGIFLILVSAASFGSMAIFGKFAYTSGISTHSLLFYRFLLASLVMLPIALLQKKRFPKGKDLFILIGMGVIGYAGQSYCYFTGLTLIPAPLLVMLLYLYPVMVAVLAIFFLDEKLTRNKLIALFLAVTGAVLVIGFEANGNMKGIFLGVSAAVIYSVYTIVGARVMSRNDAFTASLVVIASACFFYGIYNIKSGFFVPQSWYVWLNIVAIAILCTAVAIYTYFLGMKLSGAVNAAMLSTFEPVTTMVLAALFLGQRIGLQQTIGAALILASAVIVTMQAKK